MSASRLLMTAACAALFASAFAFAQGAPPPPPPGGLPSPLLPENSVTRVSDHVYAIMGFPNIGIVVGESATLVVDTGLGARNGAIAAQAAQKLAKGPVLYLTTTHFHPEHAFGDAGFPASAKLVRCRVQQEELDKNKADSLMRFRANPSYAALLPADYEPRKPDMLFDRETVIDLGGLHVRLMCYGPAHTDGDEVAYIEEDGVMITGDVVQNKATPGITGSGNPRTWIAVLDRLAPIKPKIILPDHTPVGDGSLIASERAFLSDIQTRALQLKAQGVDAAQAGQTITAELQKKYPEWPIRNLSGVVQRVYDDKGP